MAESSWISGFSPLSAIATGFFAVFGLLLLFYPDYFWRIWDRATGRVPAGPTAYPILGTIDVDRKRPDFTFRNWTLRYGNIFSFFLGTRFCVGVSDLRVLRRILKDERFSGRKNAGIFAHLRTDLTKGVGKHDSSQPLQKQSDLLIQRIRHFNGEPFDPKHILVMATANTLASIVLSREFTPDDPGFNGFLEIIEKNMQEFANAVVMEVYPWLRHIFPFTRKFARLNDRVTESFVYLMSLVQEQKNSFDPANPRDYFDAFFCAQERQKRATGNVGTFTDLQLVRNMADIFITGYETTSTFLRWCLVYMILHPDVHDRVQEEIDIVIGQHRPPNFSDEDNMPYTRAVLLEVQRISAFVPFSVPHCVSEDVELAGYHLPKGTEIWPLIGCHFMNPTIWTEPEMFRPDRFLDSDGCLITSLSDEIQPYGFGRRTCIGEPLARAELFTFFTVILQNFNIISDQRPSTIPVVTQVMAPPPFTIVALPR